MFKTKITTQGTISIPIALRKKYGLEPGLVVKIEDRNGIIITKNPDFASLRSKNTALVTQTTPYQSGDGFNANIHEKYKK